VALLQPAGAQRGLTIDPFLDDCFSAVELHVTLWS